MTSTGRWGAMLLRCGALGAAFAGAILAPPAQLPAHAYQQCAKTTTGGGAQAGSCVGPNWEYGGCGTAASPAAKTSVYWCQSRPLQAPDLPVLPMNG